jgi:hypothetical protein
MSDFGPSIRAAAGQLGERQAHDRQQLSDAAASERATRRFIDPEPAFF